MSPSSSIGQICFQTRRNPLEKGMATHSSILGWRIPWTEEPGRLQSMGVAKSHTWLNDNTFTFWLGRASVGQVCQQPLWVWGCPHKLCFFSETLLCTLFYQDCSASPPLFGLLWQTLYTGGLLTQRFTSPVLGPGKFKIKALSDSVLRTCFLVHWWPSSCCVCTWQKGQGSSLGSLCKGTNLIHEGSILMT